jgi:hypothetical protein
VPTPITLGAEAAARNGSAAASSPAPFNTLSGYIGDKAYLDPDGVDVYGWAVLDSMRSPEGTCRCAQRLTSTGSAAAYTLCPPCALCVGLHRLQCSWQEWAACMHRASLPLPCVSTCSTIVRGKCATHQQIHGLPCCAVLKCDVLSCCLPASGTGVAMPSRSSTSAQQTTTTSCAWHCTASPTPSVTAVTRPRQPVQAHVLLPVA